MYLVSSKNVFWLWRIEVVFYACNLTAHKHVKFCHILLRPHRLIHCICQVMSMCTPRFLWPMLLMLSTSVFVYQCSHWLFTAAFGFRIKFFPNVESGPCSMLQASLVILWLHVVVGFIVIISVAFGALTLLVVQKGTRPVKNWAVGCWRGYLSGARCRLAYGPADATATHCFLLQ